MASHKSEFLNIAQERGFFHQCTDLEGLDKLLNDNKPVTAYVGFDCTGPSLHIGHLLSIMMLRWFQKTGHKPIALIGGGTTKIGDPSGKDESRKLLTTEIINRNLAGYRKTFHDLLDFESNSNNAVMLNNADWLEKLHYIELLRDYGRHFSINRMLSMDSVKLRLEREQELSFLEFNYMILQAYDFVELHKSHQCRLQIGGSDQWGNIVNGVELFRRLMAEKNQGRQNQFDELFGLTTPLMMNASGAKMGKTASGAVWLNAELLSPFEYWQFWRNTEDGDVGRFLRLFTELPLAEIEKLERLQGAEINEAKKILADAATTLCHGAEAAQMAADTARQTFEQGGASEHLKTVFIEKAQLEAGLMAFELLHLAGVKESKSEARKLIEGGGARINDEKIGDARMRVTLEQFGAEGQLKLSAGKKQHMLVKLK